MGAWQDERIDLVEELLGEYPPVNPDTGAPLLLGYRNPNTGILAEYPLINPPFEQIKQLTDGPYMMTRPISFVIRNADFASSGIKNKSDVTFQGFTMQVFSIIQDPGDEGTTLGCVLKQ